MNNNNGIISDNLWKIPRPYFCFKTTVGMRKYFFGVYGQFGHVRSESLASPVLAEVVQRMSTETNCSQNVECPCTHLACSLTDEDGHGVRSACFSHSVIEQSASLDWDTVDEKIYLEADRLLKFR
jgi:hypothetical protein